MEIINGDGVISVGVDIPQDVRPFVRDPYNYDRKFASDITGVDCTNMPSMTKQAFAEEADINTIVRRFGLTGELPQDVAVPQSGDFLEAKDFHESMNLIRQAEEAFMEMPAEVRKRFGNDPGEFLDFVNDERNRDEARKLGLLVPEIPPVPKAEPIEVRVVADPVPPSPPAPVVPAR